MTSSLKLTTPSNNFFYIFHALKIKVAIYIAYICKSIVNFIYSGNYIILFPLIGKYLYLLAAAEGDNH